jgi:hypothetical protein
VRVGEFSVPLYRGGFLLLAVVTAVLVAAVAHPRSGLGRLLGRQPMRYLGERSYAIYLWHWPVFLLTRPGFELGLGGAPAVVLRLGLVLVLAEASYRFIERPIRQGAVGRTSSRLAASQGVERLRLGRQVLVIGSAVTLLVGFVVVGLSTGGAADEDRAGSVEASAPVGDAQPGSSPAATDAPSPLAPRSPEVALPAPADPVAPTASPDPGLGVDPPRVSLFGDSVMLGAAAELESGLRDAVVDAAESRSATDLVERVRRAVEAGRLAPRVVLHTGTNGPVAEETVRTVLELTSSAERVVVLTTHVPRPWQDYNNDVLARVVPTFPNAVLLDWHRLAEGAGQAWLYDDGIHLRPGAGRDGYAAAVRDAVRSRAAETG